jgi:hypothetical protein
MTSSLYAQTGFPLFQNRTYGTAADAISCESGDIDLGQDAATGIVINRAFDAARLIYDTDYNNEQSFSAPFRAHMEAVADLIEAHLGTRSLIEVGCGKGAFLESMAARGAEISGFDPAYEGSNSLIRKAYFSPDMGMTGEGLILRHVLEHIPDPVDFLGQLAGANGGRGLIYIEVPCLDWILTNRAWFDIFYEHVNYFRLEDFQRMFGRVLVGERRFGGQYLSVIADLATLRGPEPGAAVAWPEDFAAKLTQGAPGGMVWGGASKGVIFSLLRQRAGLPVDGVIDINPAKQTRFLPGSGLEVMSPATAMALLPDGASIYVMNPNYLAEVQAMTQGRYTYESMSQ